MGKYHVVFIPKYRREDALLASNSAGIDLRPLLRELRQRVHAGVGYNRFCNPYPYRTRPFFCKRI
jgi:hypothetical protein